MARLSDSIFKISWGAFIADTLPSFLRIQIWTDWLFALAKPFRRIHDDFLSHRIELLDKVSITGQKAVLEAFLNKKLGPGIYIVLYERPKYTLKIPDNSARTVVVRLEDGGAAPGDYLPEAYHPKLADKSPTDPGPDFSVFVPSAMSAANQLQVKALVTAYKTYGTTFTIETY
jgi:hypothetical protein